MIPNEKVLTEIAQVQQAVGTLWNQVDVASIAAKAQAQHVSEKLDIWIDTNRLLLTSTQELLKVIVQNSQEMQRSAHSYETGTQFWQHLQQQLDDFAKVTTQLSAGLQQWQSLIPAATPTDSNLDLDEWKRAIAQLTTLQESITPLLPAIQTVQQTVQQSVTQIPKPSRLEPTIGIAKTGLDKWLSWDVLPIALLSGGLLLSGSAIGWMSGQLMRPELAPGPMRSLTLDEAETLRWANTTEGKLARNLVRWNDDLLANLACTREAERLGVTLKVEGNPATYGFCTVWVVPPDQRIFERPAKK